MDYFEIIKKAFKVTLRHKFLWIFGILAGGAAGANSFNFQMPSSGFDDSWNKYFSQNLSDVDWTVFWANYGTLILILLVIFTILAIVFFVLNLVSQGSLIGAADKMYNDHEPTFGDSFMIGWHNFWRIWGLNITLLLAILIGLSVWILPVCALVVSGAYVSAWIVGILLFLVNFFFWIFIAFISPYALRIVVLKKHGIFESIRESLHLVRDNWINVLVIYLILMMIGFAVGIVLVIAVLLIIALLVSIGIGLYYLSPIALAAYAIMMSLVLLIACLAFSGMYSTFTSTILTFTYIKLAAKN